MTLRSLLLAASVACLLVVIAAFFGIERRQQRVLLDQLDNQLTLVAARAPALADVAERPTSSPPDPVIDAGELYIGAVTIGGLVTGAAPASSPGLAPELDDIERAPRNEPVTVGTSDPGVDMRVIVLEVDAVALVVGQSTESIDDAIRNLRLSGLVAIAVISAFALIVGWWVNRLSIQPIRVVTEVAHTVTAGRRDERVPHGSATTEAATLGAAMNLMLDATADTETRLRSFVADASHELRTPLTTLMGYAEMHQQGLLASDEAVDDAMRRIRGEAKRMSTIVEHLFLLANLDEGTLPIELTTIDVGQLLEDVAADARVVQPDRPITVEVPTPVEAAADAERLLQAVSVLVTNALTHTPTSAALSLTAEANGDTVLIRVIDEGPGVAPEHLGRLFDRFYRVNQGRDRAQGGSGLGLAIARSIAEAHRGTLDVESAVGQGSTFALRIPKGQRPGPQSRSDLG